MLVRFALVGLAVAGLASPVGAQEATPEAAQAQSDGVSSKSTARSHHRGRPQRVARAAAEPAADAAEPAAAETDVAEPESSARRKGAAARPKIVAILPPLRPTDEPFASAEAAPAAAAEAAVVEAALSEAGEPIGVPAAVPSKGGVVMPAVAVEAPLPVVPADRAGAPIFVSIMPPLRPSFAGEEMAALEAPAPAAEEAPAEAPIPAALVTPTGKFVYVIPPARPAFSWDSDSGAPLPGEITAVETQQAAADPAAAAAQPQQQQQQPGLLAALFGTPAPTTPEIDFGGDSRAALSHGALDALVAKHARLNGVPVSLVQRVVMRESRYNPRAVGRGGALGLMQIKHGTARALGYMGPASGLLDAETNLTYAVKYLAGAYRTAGGDFNRAVAYYARGYYNAAKRAGTMLLADRRHNRGIREEAEARPEDVAAQ